MGIFSNVSDVIGDSEKLTTLRSDLGDEVVVMLLDRVQETVTDALSALKVAIDANDVKEIREVAHSLKGATGSLYAVQFAEMAAVIEKLHADLQVVGDAFDQFEQSGQATLNWWLNKNKEFANS